ncbi:Beta-adaptin-like protein B, partial [Cucurbita argyrosperma subsp. argyrosperma]
MLGKADLHEQQCNNVELAFNWIFDRNSVVALLNNATVETDDPDLRYRAYIYWRLLSTDPEVVFQNMSQGPPSSLLQVAVKNNQHPVWYFNDKISMHIFFAEDGTMERTNFLETWRSLPDSNEVSRDFSTILINNVDAIVD